MPPIAPCCCFGGGGDVGFCAKPLADKARMHVPTEAAPSKSEMNPLRMRSLRTHDARPIRICGSEERSNRFPRKSELDALKTSPALMRCGLGCRLIGRLRIGTGFAAA